VKTPIEVLRSITEDQWLEIIDKSSEKQQAVLKDYKERITNLILYGNSWSNDELQIILNKEKTNDN
jgi:GTPase involved in cell partitioning and DNA repair